MDRTLKLDNSSETEKKGKRRITRHSGVVAVTAAGSFALSGCGSETGPTNEPLDIEPVQTTQDEGYEGVAVQTEKPTQTEAPEEAEDTEPTTEAETTNVSSAESIQELSLNNEADREAIFSMFDYKSDQYDLSPEQLNETPEFDIEFVVENLDERADAAFSSEFGELQSKYPKLLQEMNRHLFEFRVINAGGLLSKYKEIDRLVNEPLFLTFEKDNETIKKDLVPMYQAESNIQSSGWPLNAPLIPRTYLTQYPAGEYSSLVGGEDTAIVNMIDSEMAFPKAQIMQLIRHDQEVNLALDTLDDNGKTVRENRLAEGLDVHNQVIPIEVLESLSYPSDNSVNRVEALYDQFKADVQRTYSNGSIVNSGRFALDKKTGAVIQTSTSEEVEAKVASGEAIEIPYVTYLGERGEEQVTSTDLVTGILLPVPYHTGSSSETGLNVVDDTRSSYIFVTVAISDEAMLQ